MGTDTTIRNLESKHVWDYENGYYWFSNQTRLTKALAQYELYKRIVQLPGDVLELGVYKGLSLLRFATFRNVLENDHSRKIVGFDIFGTFPRENLALENDHQFVKRFEEEGGDGLKKAELETLIQGKGFTNVELVEGNTFETLNAYLTRFPATRIALLHLDMDVQEPTAHALELLFERVVTQGIVMIDDYNSVEGATLAVDAFTKAHGLTIQKLPYYSTPAFIVKT